MVTSESSSYREAKEKLFYFYMAEDRKLDGIVLRKTMERVSARIGFPEFLQECRAAVPSMSDFSDLFLGIDLGADTFTHVNVDKFAQTLYRDLLVSVKEDIGKEAKAN